MPRYISTCSRNDLHWRQLDEWQNAVNRKQRKIHEIISIELLSLRMSYLGNKENERLRQLLVTAKWPS